MPATKSAHLHGTPMSRYQEEGRRRSGERRKALIWVGVVLAVGVGVWGLMQLI